MIGGLGSAAVAQGAIAPGLIERARSGDADSFDLIVRHRIDQAFRVATAITGSEADARDCVQEAFLHAWRDLPRLRDVDRFDAWFGRILVNSCRSSLRHRRRVDIREVRADRAVDADDDRPPSVERLVAPSTLDPHLVVDEADLFARALARLSVDARTVLVLHYVADRPLADIAATLRIPLGTAKWRLHAARASLERALGEERR